MSTRWKLAAHLTLAAAMVTLLFGLVYVLRHPPAPTPGMQAAEAERAQEERRQLETQRQQAAAKTVIAKQLAKRCDALVQQAANADIFRKVDTSSTGRPRVLAGPGFYLIDIDTKRNLAVALNCYYSRGDRDECTNFEISDWRTGKDVAHFWNCRFAML